MRKTSQDGGDSISITSGFENEIKKPGANKLKAKRSSFKKKVQNFSHESDDAAIEPLLQKDKEKAEIANRSAKLLLSKTKTETSFDKGTDKDRLLTNTPESKSSVASALAALEHTPYSNGINENIIKATIQNHMNTNIFQEITVPNLSTKSNVLDEIDESKKNQAYNPSPLIFTVAKIHTDNKSKQMEPVQVTPVPISSTTEGVATLIASERLNPAIGRKSSIKGEEIKSPLLGSMAKKESNASSHLVQSKDQSTKNPGEPVVKKTTENNQTCNVSKVITLADLTKMADLKTVYSLSDIQKSPGILKNEPIIQSGISQENKDIPNKKSQDEVNVSINKNPVLQTTSTVTMDENSKKTSVSTSVTSVSSVCDVNKNVARIGNGDIKSPTAVELSSKSNLDKIPNVTDNLTKTPSINKSLQRQKTTSEEITPAEKSKIGTVKADKQNISTVSAIPKSIIDKPSSNKSVIRSSSKTTESCDVINKKSTTTQVTKTNTTAPSTVKSITKIPSTTSIESSTSSKVSTTKVSSPREVSNKTGITKVPASDTKPPVSLNQVKGSSASKSAATAQISKASTVSTIISSNLPQSSSKLPDVAKKSVPSSISKTNPSAGSADKQSTVTTMKTSSTKNVSSSSAGNKPVSAKSTVASTAAITTGTKNKAKSEQKPSQGSKDIKSSKT